MNKHNHPGCERTPTRSTNRNNKKKWLGNYATETPEAPKQGSSEGSVIVLKHIHGIDLTADCETNYDGISTLADPTTDSESSVEVIEQLAAAPSMPRHIRDNDVVQRPGREEASRRKKRRTEKRRERRRRARESEASELRPYETFWFNAHGNPSDRLNAWLADATMQPQRTLTRAGRGEISPNKGKPHWQPPPYRQE